MENTNTDTNRVIVWTVSSDTAGALVEAENLPGKSRSKIAAQIIASLTPEQRLELFSHYCSHCGNADPPLCQCKGIY